MGRSKMSSLKITLLPLAICLLLSLNSQVSGKPSPKHFLIETKEKAKRTSDYDIKRHIFNINPGPVSNDYDINAGHFANNGGTVVSHGGKGNDYDINANSFVNHGHVVSNDYDVNSRVLNNNGGTINSKDYTFPRSMIRRWNRGVTINSKDY